MRAENGECPVCERLASEQAAREVKAMRGRWLIVFQGGGAVRCRRLSVARGHARQALDAGVPARVIRYRRDRVVFDESVPQHEVTDSRWLP